MTGRGADRAAVDSFFRRQLVLAAVAGAVVLVGLLAVTALLGAGESDAHAVLRPGSEMGRVEPASPMAESTRAATWAAAVVLVAVLAVLALVVVHVVGVARFTLPRSRRSPSSKEGE
ncbi:MAG TPA: hypothetical protein VHE80_02885 [Acidimicrobiales bacterium]|nr:hypothetical protein [Acidimicrobiales bacterium]